MMKGNFSRHQCDKNKSISAFSGWYYNTKLKNRDFKTKTKMKPDKDDDSKSEEEQDSDDGLKIRSNFKLLFNEDNYSLMKVLLWSYK